MNSKAKRVIISYTTFNLKKNPDVTNCGMYELPKLKLTLH